VGNLDKPESEALVPLNFKVPGSFSRCLALSAKITAARRGKDMVEQLYECVALLKRTEGLDEESTK
jgi:hypothetical protein